MAELPLTGGCLCGAVRFEIDAPLVSASWCHCTRCQRRTGTPASVQARIAPGSFRLLQGEEALREFKPPTRAGRRCSAASAARASGAGAPTTRRVMGVRLGAFDGDPGIRPSYHQYVTYAASWAPIPDDGLPRYPERKPA